MWFKLKKGKSIEVQIEYHASMRKLGALTMKELEEAYKKDPDRNFDARMAIIEEERLQAIKAKEEQDALNADPKKKKAAEAKKPAPAPAAKKKTKKELEEEELELVRQQELEEIRKKEELKK